MHIFRIQNCIKALSVPRKIAFDVSLFFQTFIKVKGILILHLRHRDVLNYQKIWSVWRRLS